AATHLRIVAMSASDSGSASSGIARFLFFSVSSVTTSDSSGLPGTRTGTLPPFDPLRMFSGLSSARPADNSGSDSLRSLWQTVQFFRRIGRTSAQYVGESAAGAEEEEPQITQIKTERDLRTEAM